MATSLQSILNQKLIVGLNAAMQNKLPKRIEMSYDLFSALERAGRITDIKSPGDPGQPSFETPHFYEGILDGKYPVAVRNFAPDQHFQLF